MGVDFRRLNMLLAVLEKRAGFKLASKDVFLNIAGGLKVDDPALDLAIIGAILSSTFDVPVNSKVCLAGEVGLSGEVRPVSKIEQRIGEAEKLGFKKIVISGFNKKNISSKYKIQVQFINKVEQLSPVLFGKKQE
jgi:DNA repair protein RadA/Sms